MSLYGALFSGVSGLTAQSSAMGAISDNITNVSTIGYKNTKVNFQTLVTKQTSATFYSAGGVQSKPRQNTDVQGLLQSSTSQTDIAISGSGFFVVNEVGQPGINNQYLFTRAGSFKMDNDGYLRNSSGFYLQGWPTDASGNVKPANDQLTIANQNIISTDYLETINLNRVGGTAAATSNIGIGANLPATDTEGTTHKTDVQFFDTLGNANSMSFVYSRSGRKNEWDVSVTPPQRVSALTIEDTSGNAYASVGQLEFTARPADGSQVVIDSITYEFDSTAYTLQASAGNSYAINSVAETITAAAGTFSNVKAGDILTITNAEDAGNNSTVTVTTVAADGSSITTNGMATTNAADSTMLITYSAFTQTSSLRRVATATNTTIAQDVSTLVSTVKGYDTDFANYGTSFTNNRIQVSPGSSTTVLFTEDGTKAFSINPSALLDSSGDPVTNQTTTFTVRNIDDAYRDYMQFTFGVTPATGVFDDTDVPADGDTITVNGIIYTFDSGEAVDAAGGDTTISTLAGSVATMLTDLKNAIDAQDSQFAGDRCRLRKDSNDAVNNTLVLDVLDSGSYNVSFSAGFTNTPVQPETRTSTAATAYSLNTDIAVNKTNAIIFDSDGLPLDPGGFNISEIEILGFASGAADMDDDAAHAPQITLDFGTEGEADGMTQFGEEFTPIFINQNGSRFGTFAGVTVDTNGLVTALFDNGEIRNIYQIPVATFVNPNSLENRTGNVWNATQDSGDYTLRVADNGPAGQVVQGSLEASTVDIGEEFTNMIVVQRAYSASAKIISTADEMLAELMNVKR